MIDMMIVGILIFVVAVLMTMVGKGGGNFYVVILALANIPMHQAATTGQFILFAASVAAMVVFQKNKSVSWPMVMSIGAVTAISALGGGYYSHLFSGFSLKILFTVMLLIAGVVMLIPVTGEKKIPKKRGFGIIDIPSNDGTYSVNLWIALPVTALTGFGSGMVGVSGGSFLVPLMVLACGLPMHTAVGTASALIAITTFMGFTGHAVQGDFDPSWAIPLAFVTVLGGLIGGRFSLKSKPKHLKAIFAYTNWLAAIFMIINAFHAKGLV